MTPQRKTEAEIYRQGIARGEIPALSRAITLAESTLPEHKELARQIITWCLPRSGKSVRVGITGIPGVGKSSFIESLGLYLARECGKKIAVLAIDPTSSETRGSVLGDKLRMQELSRHENVYIRPSPSSGSLGGVAKRTSDAIILCEAAGFDTIFIETVGVGQSEITCHSMVDFFMLLMITGAGDDIQGIKRGIIERADAVVITKADGRNKERAELMKQEMEESLRFHRPPESSWIPRTCACSSVTGYGIKKIWQCVRDYEDLCKESGYFAEKRKKQSKYRLHEALIQSLENSFYESSPVKEVIGKVEKQVMEGKTDPYTGAANLLDLYFETLGPSRSARKNDHKDPLT